MGTTDWKQKATTRALDIKKLKKKIKELEASREAWKKKSLEHKSHADTFEAKFIRLKDNINKVLTETN
jgi:hypothetical protein